MQHDPCGEHSLGQDAERVCRQRVDPCLGADLGIGREEVGQLVIAHTAIVADRRSPVTRPNEAKEQKRGLWRDPGPVSPWEWRKAQSH